MSSTSSDFTNSFRCLSRLSIELGDSTEFEDKNIPTSWLPTLNYLIEQSATLEEKKKLHRPKMQSRSVNILKITNHSC